MVVSDLAAEHVEAGLLLIFGSTGLDEHCEGIYNSKTVAHDPFFPSWNNAIWKLSKVVPFEEKDRSSLMSQDPEHSLRAAHGGGCF